MPYFNYFSSCLIKNPCNIGNITKCAGFLFTSYNSEPLKGFNISVAFLPKSKHRVTRFEYSINDFCVSNGNCFWSPLIGLRHFFYENGNGKIVNSENIGNYPTMHWSPLISPHPSRLSAVIVSSLWPPLLLYPSFSSFCPFDRQDPPRAF